MTAARPADQEFTHREVVVILFGVMLVIFLVFLDQTIVATALPSIAADLKGDASLSWIVAGYLMASTAVTPIYGKLSDYYGRRLLLQAALILFIIASILCAMASSMPMLVAFRILQGIGGGGLLTTAHSAIGDAVSPLQRGKYQGYISCNVLFSNAIGPVLGGFFADHLGWRWIFWINIPLGILAIGVLHVALAKLSVKRLKHKIDYLGAVLVMAALAAVLLVTTLGGADIPWTSPTLIWLASLACVLVSLATVWEFRVPEAILPPRLFRSGIFTASVLGTSFVTMCLFGMTVFLPLYLQVVYGLSADRVGIIILPQTLGMVFGSLATGLLIGKLRRYRIFPLVGTPIAIAGLVMLALGDHSTPLSLTVTAMALLSIGVGICQPATIIAAQNAIDPYDLGAATAVLNCCRSMFTAFGVALFSAVLIGRMNALLVENGVHGIDALNIIHAGPAAGALGSPAERASLTAAIDQGFRDMFLAALGTAVLGLLAFMLLRDIPLRTTSGTLARQACEQVVAAAAADGAE